MPSFRVTMTIGLMRPGVAPERVVPTAAAAAGELATVEASGVDVVAGQARVTIRFTAGDAHIARRIGAHVVSATSALAETRSSTLMYRTRGRWSPLG
ncbi:hypothetical protein FHR81_001775 [Actinoalloteichus hoggarensis]|uniref:Uncharacterized protein n=1 Tax=Actinoalloteichus hoggarensis TaxID=1470176 RepID=A0A221W4N4_9PSEU|nr:hypothetical protein [Actinoalloteichus hoggarensis]ASO20808.1 hypothetical protein AHOG_15910 [Actinoalloteichus hoggarensis]MBB5920737.1 hypothetical protein [Actinoalloteichus hoggarensis]